jgi:hypothetical protein
VVASSPEFCASRVQGHEVDAVTGTHLDASAGPGPDSAAVPYGLASRTAAFDAVHVSHVTRVRCSCTGIGDAWDVWAPTRPSWVAVPALLRLPPTIAHSLMSLTLCLPPPGVLRFGAALCSIQAAGAGAGASAAALDWWTDTSAVLDIDTDAVPRARAYGLADEALCVVAADKPDRLADEEKERISARRMVNQLAKVRGEGPVVEVPVQPSTAAGQSRVPLALRGCASWLLCGRMFGLYATCRSMRWAHVL